MAIVVTVLVEVGLLLWFLLARASRAIDNDTIIDWAGARRLVVTDVNRPLVRRYLRTGKQLRTIGGIAGAVLPPLIGAAFGVHRPDASLGWIFFGYLVGALYAELVLSRPIGTQRIALLSARRLCDYMSLELRVAQAVVPLLAVAVGAWVCASRLPDDLSRSVAWPSSVRVWEDVAAVFAIAILVRLLQRHFIGRAQRVVHPDLLAADDAIRASSVHLVAGSGLAIELLVVASLLSKLEPTIGTGWPWPDYARVVCLAFAGLAWLGYRTRAWPVRRRLTLSPPVPTASL